MELCDRCYKEITNPDEHGHMLCPYEARRDIGLHAVIGDDIPGGVEIKHGICNEDGTPRRYYSKSEMAREAKRRGLTNYVVHTPERGSDKSKHTTRWV